MEKAIIEAILKRKKSAFTIFYNEFSDKFYAFLKATYFLSDEEIKDIIADTFVKIWRKLDSFDNSKWNFTSWCWLILRNTIKDFFKKKKDLSFSDLTNKNTEANFEDSLEDDSNNLELLEQDYQLNTIKKAMAELKSEEREIIYLRYLDGFSLEEIANIMWLSYGNTRVKLSRSLAKLKKYLEHVT